jgi:hypothetical protein
MAIDADTERMMVNWALWRSGSLTGVAVSGAYELEARGRYEETPMPLINGEACEVDQAVARLDAPLKLAVEEYWLRTGPVVDKARRCGCEAKTLYRRLDRAHESIKAFREERQRASERARAELSHSHDQNRRLR